jgi:sRNA-binding protein
MQERFPKVFDAAAPLPLALGIRQQLQLCKPESDFGYMAVSKALAGWVSRPEYLQALSADGSQRFSLAGMPEYPVKNEHREHARELLRQHQETTATDYISEDVVTDTTACG